MQCFDAVGWAARRTACKKLRVLGSWHGYLTGARCGLAYGPADATATHYLLLQFSPDWFYLSGTGSPGVALAMDRSLQWFIHLRAHGLDREMSTPPTLSRVEYSPFTLPLPSVVYPPRPRSLLHHCCSSAATSRRHCFSHRTLHHSVWLYDRL